MEDVFKRGYFSSEKKEGGDKVYSAISYGSTNTKTKNKEAGCSCCLDLTRK